MPYETVVKAFKSVGIDAQFDETTADRVFHNCVALIKGLSTANKRQLKEQLLKSNQKVFDDFFVALKEKLDRIIDRVVVLPLFGTSKSFPSVDEAASFIDEFNVKYAEGPFQKYELIVVYSNSDEIKGIFSSKDRAKDFLRYVSH